MQPTEYSALSPLQWLLKTGKALCKVSVWSVLFLATVETWHCNVANSVEDDMLPLNIKGLFYNNSNLVIIQRSTKFISDKRLSLNTAITE